MKPNIVSSPGLRREEGARNTPPGTKTAFGAAKYSVLLAYWALRFRGPDVRKDPPTDSDDHILEH